MDATATLLSFPLAALLLLFIFLLLLLPQLSSDKPSKPHLLPPGPAPWPIVGSLLTMLRNKPHFRWVLSLADGKDITCVRLGSVHSIIVNSPDLAREFLKKHDASFASRPLTMATEYSGRGFLSVVICPWGDQWKKMRRVIASEVLSPAMLRSQKDQRQEEADVLVRYIHSLCSASKAIDIRLAVRYYSGNVIRRMIFGRRWWSGDQGRKGWGPGEEEVEHVEAAFDVLSLIYAFCPSDFMPKLRWLDLDGHERIMRKAVKVINRYHDPVIDERVEKWRGSGGDGGKKKEVEDVLDIFLSLKDGDGQSLLTMEEVRAQAAVRAPATPTPSN